jgi:hypothetical protein
MGDIPSYQRRKREIAYLEQALREANRRAEYFQKAIWDARRATGEDLGICPFITLEGNEECIGVRDSEGLLRIIRDLPLLAPTPPVSGGDFLTGGEESFSIAPFG